MLSREAKQYLQNKLKCKLKNLTDVAIIYQAVEKGFY
jgi:hypothetical protein